MSPEEENNIILIQNLWHVSWRYVTAIVVIIIVMLGVRYELSQRKIENARTANEITKRAELEHIRQTQILAEQAHQAELEREREKQEFQTKATLEAEEKKQQIIREFVSPPFISKVPETIALVTLDEQQNYDATLSARFSKILNKSGIAVNCGVFRPTFITSKIFKSLMSGDYCPEDSFKPEDYCEKLICIRTHNSTTQLTQPTDLFSTEVILTLLIISPKTGELSAPLEARGTAVGFSKNASLENAFSWAEKELTKVTPKLELNIHPILK